MMIADGLKKISSALLTLFFASVIIFAVIRLIPGDPVEIALGGAGDIPVANTQAYKDKVEEIRREYRLDEPVAVQYAAWLSHALRLDFGNSIKTRQPVISEIKRRFPATFLLSSAAMLIEVAIGVSLGILSAYASGTGPDLIIRMLCMAVLAVPGFVLGLMGIYLFGVRMHFYTISAGSGMNKLWLPAVVLALTGIPKLTRYVRANVLGELGRQYITAEIARGVCPAVIMKNAFFNAAPAIFAYIIYSFTILLGGSVVIENVFSWSGLGSYALESVLNHDYPVIQAYACVMVLFITVINLISDMLHAA